MDAFTKAFITAMFFTEEGEDNLKETTVADISKELMERIERECGEFQTTNAHLFTSENCFYTGCPVVEYAGHDFWLTRNGHGCGFWDGDWEERVGEILTASAKSFGELSVYLGDDGKIYGM